MRVAWFEIDVLEMGEVGRPWELPILMARHVFQAWSFRPALAQIVTYKEAGRLGPREETHLTVELGLGKTIDVFLSEPIVRCSQLLPPSALAMTPS